MISKKVTMLKTLYITKVNNIHTPLREILADYVSCFPELYSLIK